MKKTAIILALVLTLSITNSAYAIDIPEEAYGVIEIPCLNISQPIYIAKINDTASRQEIIDNDNSALYTRWGSAYCILDHLFSNDEDGNGEWNMQKIFAGAYAFLYTHNGNYFYECYMTGKTTYDGNEYINNKIVMPASSYDIMLACCAEDTEHHFIAAFKRLSELC